MASDIRQAPFIKQLAESDGATREKALSSLRTYLSGRRTLDDLELLKLWKGLFYCVWMSDKPRTQQRLVADLAGLVDIVPDDNVLPFLNAFWKTIAREWNGINVLRMDKYLLLVRRYLAASFHHLAKHDWESGRVARYMEILSSIPLSPTDTRHVPNGLRYHLIDIYLDELDQVVNTTAPSTSPRTETLPLDTVLQPLRTLASKSPTKAVRARATEALKDERLLVWYGGRPVGGGTTQTRGEEAVQDEHEANADEEDEEWEGFDT